MLSPATIFLSRGGFSKIPPLVGDEDFGLVAGTDLTQLVSLQAYSCVECGRCTEHCPATNTGKVLNPKEIILGLRAYLNELGPASAGAAARQIQLAGQPSSNAPPAAHANSSARSASSICPSSSACAAARSTPARGKTITAPSSSSLSNAASTHSA